MARPIADFQPYPDPRNPKLRAIRWPRPGRTASGRRARGYAGGFKNDKAAIEYARRQAAEEAGGPVVATKGTLAYFTELWLAHYADPEASRPETHRQYDRRMRIVNERWGATPVAELDGQVLVTWIRQLTRADGEPYSKSSREVIRSALVGVLNFAGSQGALPRGNPLAQVFKPRRQAARRGGDVKAIRREKVPTLAEIERARDRMPAHLRVLVDLMALAGLRPGEARGLRRDSIDFAEGELHVVSQLDVDGDTNAPTKTELSVRTVPMVERLADRLSEHLLLHAGGPDGLIVADANGNPCRDHTMHHHWRRARNRDDFKMHDLRHYFATSALAGGLDAGIVAQYLGHTPDARMTRRTYSHVTPAAGRQLRGALDAALSGGSAQHLTNAETPEPSDLAK